MPRFVKILPVLALAAALALALRSGIGGAGPAEAFIPPTGAAEAHTVAGSGSTTLGDGFPAEFRGDTVTVRLVAITTGSFAVGAFTVTHVQPDGDLVSELDGTLDCLFVDGNVARITGTITAANSPGIEEGAPEAGYVAGFIIHDLPEADAIAWAWDPVGSPCTDLPPVIGPSVELGDFIVR